MPVLRELTQIRENEFTLAPRVAGIDDFLDVLPRDQFFELREAIFGMFARFELKLRRNNWKGLEPPETVFLFVDVFRHLEFHDMTDRPRDEVTFVLVIVFALLEAAQRLGDVA